MASLPNRSEAKISHFADDTTLIVNDVDSLNGAITIMRPFSTISGLHLNPKKTKAIWIGSCKHKRSKPL